jgi:hypothetical protein
VAPSQQGWVQSVFAEYIRSGKQPAISDEHS